MKPQVFYSKILLFSYDSYSWSATTQKSRRVININLFFLIRLLYVPPIPSSLIRDTLGCQLPVCYGLDHVTLKMKALRSSETLVGFSS
jgi:hypothetical protein